MKFYTQMKDVKWLQ